jgi:predicted esterase
MIEKRIAIEKTVRYFQIGNIEESKNLLIVMHGYGQLPLYFGRQFEKLSKDFLVLIPEGMHRFYLEGSSGRVGASWMTKEAREDDIEDNMNYLEKLIKEYVKTKHFEKIILVGFSQGGATAARFFYAKRQKIDHLILWASVFPPDLNIKNEIASSSSKNFFFLGSDDPYFTEEERLKVVNFYSKMNYSIIQYPGNHSIDDFYLNKILNTLI